MSANHSLSSPEAITMLRRLTGSKLVSCGCPRLLAGTRTAIGRAFVETDTAGVLCISSQLLNYDINGILEDFAVVTISPGDFSDVATAYALGATFFDCANSVITDVGVVRTEFSREVAGEPIKTCEFDLGVVITTEKGSMSLFNASIWVNEIDFVAIKSDSSLGETEGFVSELGDVWTSNTSIVSVDRDWA
jgi:hypothetical protein